MTSQGEKAAERNLYAQVVVVSATNGGPNLHTFRRLFEGNCFVRLVGITFFPEVLDLNNNFGPKNAWLKECWFSSQQHFKETFYKGIKRRLRY